MNTISIAAEIALYLPVPIFGYLCDRYSPWPLALFSGITFGASYLLAAFTYRSGPPPDAGGSGWPFWVMVVAFVGIGISTCSLYLAAVTTCAKNFGRSKHKGVILAAPIAAFGLSGMWQSQVGTYMLYEHRADGSRGDVDVFRFFVFLAIMLFCIGSIGTFGLRIVDGEEEGRYIDEAVEQLERSGLLERPPGDEAGEAAAYGTFAPSSPANGDIVRDDTQSLPEDEQKKKNWVLNYETRMFLKDHTMWWLALGFFLVTGPGEAYVNNVSFAFSHSSRTGVELTKQVGTIIQTLTPTSYPPNAAPPAGLSSTHVTTIALTSTVARLLSGTLSDFFAPQARTTPAPTNPENGHHYYANQQQQTRARACPAISRMAFLLPAAILLALGYLLLASPLPLHHPSLTHVTTALVGFGYGSSFSLVPIIISVVWGVENFGTNWGIVAMVPAIGAAVWSVVYSRAYQAALELGPPRDDGQCRGWACFGVWAVGCTASVAVAVVVWGVAWKVWRIRGVSV